MWLISTGGLHNGNLLLGFENVLQCMTCSLFGTCFYAYDAGDMV